MLKCYPIKDRNLQLSANTNFNDLGRLKQFYFIYFFIVKTRSWFILKSQEVLYKVMMLYIYMCFKGNRPSIHEQTRTFFPPRCNIALAAESKPRAPPFAHLEGKKIIILLEMQKLDLKHPSYSTLSINSTPVLQKLV